VTKIEGKKGTMRKKFYSKKVDVDLGLCIFQRLILEKADVAKCEIIFY